MSAPIEIAPRDRLFVLTGARRTFRDNNGLSAIVQFSVTAATLVFPTLPFPLTSRILMSAF